MNLGAPELLLLVLIVLLLFGAARLPKLARSMREARDEFQKGTAEAPAPQAQQPTQPPQAGAPLAQETPPPDAPDNPS